MDPLTEESPGTAARKKGLLKDQLEVVPAPPSHTGKARYTIKPLEEQLPFDKGFYVFIRAIQYLTSRNTGTVVVGLAGPSGSGKTAFSEKVHAFIPGVTILSMDNYNDASRLVDGNFDDPRLTDYDVLLANIKDLREGRATKVPIYDFKSSTRVGYRDVSVPTSRVLIIEGIYALSARIRPLLDLRVSITGGVHFDLVKRVLRDISRSGQAPQEIIQQISDTVYPMYKAFIEPDLKTAHLRIYNTFNPFSGFMNATYILKSSKPVAAKDIKAVLQPNHTTKHESETYDIYLVPPNEDIETCQSWLRMRNRDGRYNLMFEEWVTEGPFIISPRITFEVSVRILGGLMALGYQIGTIMKRTSVVYLDDKLTIKLDDIEGMQCKFIQVQGKDRNLVGMVGAKLGLEGTYIARSYIEQVQLEKLTASFQNVTEDMRRRFAVDGAPLIEEGALGVSPSASSFTRHMGFAPLNQHRPISLASSAPVHMAPQHARSGAAGNGSTGGAGSSGERAAGGLLSHQMAANRNAKAGISIPGGPNSASMCGSSHQHLANGHAHDRQAGNSSDAHLAAHLAKMEKAVARLSERVEELRPDVTAVDGKVTALSAGQARVEGEVAALAEALAAVQANGVPAQLDARSTAMVAAGASAGAALLTATALLAWGGIAWLRCS